MIDLSLSRHLPRMGFMVMRDQHGVRFGWAFTWGRLWIEWKNLGKVR